MPCAVNLRGLLADRRASFADLNPGGGGFDPCRAAQPRR